MTVLTLTQKPDNQLRVSTTPPPTRRTPPSAIARPPAPSAAPWRALARGCAASRTRPSAPPSSTPPPSSSSCSATSACTSPRPRPRPRSTPLPRWAVSNTWYLYLYVCGTRYRYQVFGEIGVTEKYGLELYIRCVSQVGIGPGVQPGVEIDREELTVAHGSWSNVASARRYGRFSDADVHAIPRRMISEHPDVSAHDLPSADGATTERT